MFYLMPSGKIAKQNDAPVNLSEKEFISCCCTVFRRGLGEYWLSGSEWQNPMPDNSFPTPAIGGLVAHTQSYIYIRYADLYDKLCFEYSTLSSSPGDTSDINLYELSVVGRAWPTLPPALGSFGAKVWSVVGATPGTSWCIDISGISTTWLVIEKEPSASGTITVGAAFTDDCAECAGLLA